jgi:hypothetical protein
MKKVMTGGLVALLLAALVGLLSMASIGSAAPTARQYNKPVLTLSVTHIGVSPDGDTFYFMRVDGAGYAEGDTASGTLTLTCTKGTTTCGPGILAWGPIQVGASGSFISSNIQFNCPSNVKSAVTIDDVNGVKSNSTKGAC